MPGPYNPGRLLDFFLNMLDGTDAITALPVKGTPVQGSVQRVTAGGAAPGQTIKSFSGRYYTLQAGTTTIGLYTVTTGKTFLLTDVFLTTDSALGLDVQIQAGVSTIFRSFVASNAPTNGPGLESQPTATTGQVVSILLPTTPSGVVNFIWTICGVEQ